MSNVTCTNLPSALLLKCRDPHTLVNINKLECIQRLAARFNYSWTSSVTSMFKHTELFYLRREDFIANVL